MGNRTQEEGGELSVPQKSEGQVTGEGNNVLPTIGEKIDHLQIKMHDSPKKRIRKGGEDKKSG